jgi:hypothetical protein
VVAPTVLLDLAAFFKVIVSVRSRRSILGDVNLPLDESYLAIWLRLVNVHNDESDDSDEFNQDDYPQEFWTPVSSTTRNHSSHRHSGFHSGSRELSQIPSHEPSRGHKSSRRPPREYSTSGGFDPNNYPPEFWEPVVCPHLVGPPVI